MLTRIQPKDTALRDGNGNVMSDSQFGMDESIEAISDGHEANDAANYLAELRINRTARLNGSRPPPPSRHATKREKPREDEQDISATTQKEQQKKKNWSTNHAGRPLVPEPLSFRSSRTQSQRTRTPSLDRTTGMTRSTSGSSYVELGVRKQEREEAHSLRLALEDKDAEEDRRVYEAAQDEASRLVLEHRHPKTMKKSEAAYSNPDLQSEDSGESRLEKTKTGVQQKTANTQDDGDAIESEHCSLLPSMNTAPPTENMIVDGGTQHTQPRKVKSYHGLASAVARDVENSKRRVSSGSRRKASAGKGPFSNPDDKIYEEPEEGSDIVTSAPAQEAKPASTIPEIISETATAEIPSHVRRNPFARVRFNQEKLARTKTAPVEIGKQFNAVEIHKNTPSQSRKPWYLSNKVSNPAMKEANEDKAKPGESIQTTPDPDAPGMKHGLEIRGDDIRAATTMKRTDRSPNLPQPTAVTDSPGRPIVSFEKTWKVKEVEKDDATATLPSPSDSRLGPIKSPTVPAEAASVQSKISISAAEYHAAAASKPSVNMGILPSVAIPSISLPDDDFATPSRTLPEEPVIPAINLESTTAVTRPTTAPARALPPRPEPAEARSTDASFAAKTTPTPQHSPSKPLGRSGTRSSRPLPDPARHEPAHIRPLPHHSSTAPVADQIKPHYTPSVKRATALCAHCALPIAGRILTAAGERFHPECFTCHQCGTNLECVAFYPEPDQKHYERIARIQQRNQGLEIAFSEDMTYEEVRRLEAEDGDESMRFFCHLDYHELFSPRCKSCRTPIEGEVVVACGAEWHVGHFFCAQCGDPFDSSTPFVEREGYAWCLGCHTHRYSPKCKGCRKPITDLVVNALGAEWHGDCFCCMECGGGFDDGRYFLRGNSTDPVCVRCEDRRLKS